jgi:tetratricopeptide (TPR) repeat protein
MSRAWNRLGRAVAPLLAAAALLACSASLPNESQIQGASPAALQGIEEVLRRVLRTQPEDPRTLLLLSRTLLRRGALAEAEQLALKADEVAPAQGVILALLAEVQLAQDKRFRALNTATQAVQFDPTLLSAYITMARAHALLGEPAKAYKALDEAIRRERRYFPAWYQRARILYETGALKEAAAALDEALRINSGAKEALLLRIKITKKAGRPVRADFLTEDALKLWPEDPDLLQELLDSYRQRQDWPAASGVLERLRKLGPLSPEAQLTQLELYRAQNLDAAYTRGLTTLVTEHPRYAPALLLQAKDLLADGNAADAVKALNRAVDLDPGYVEAQFWRAIALYQAGETVQGDAALVETARLAPNYGPVRLLRISRRMSERRLDVAAAELEDYLAEFPSDPDALLLKSEWLVLSGDYVGAQRLLTGIPPTRDDRALRLSRARLAYLRGEYRAVLAQTAPLLKQYGPAWRVVYLQAAATARLGQPAEAIALIKPYLNLAEADGRMHRLAGDIYALAGDRQNALKSYADGLKLFPGRLSLIEGLSRAAMDADNWALARETLEGGLERESEYRTLFLDRLSIVSQRLGDPRTAQRYRGMYLNATDPLIAELRFPPDQSLMAALWIAPLERRKAPAPAGQTAPPPAPAPAPPGAPPAKP